MFEVECPSCRANYQVDERRVPPGGLKMRCPKCGESFQVNAGGVSDPPVLGAALGLSRSVPPRGNRRQTMLGVPDQAGPSGAPAQGPGGGPPRPAGGPPRPAGGPPRPGGGPAGGPPRPGPGSADSGLLPGLPRRRPKATMMGVAPAQPPSDDQDPEFDLASDPSASSHPPPAEPEEFDLQADPGFDLPEDEVDLPAPSTRAGNANEIDLPMDDLDEHGGSDELGDDFELGSAQSALPDLDGDLPDLPANPDRGTSGSDVLGDELDLPSVGGGFDEADLPSFADEAELPSPAADLPSPQEAGLPTPSAGLPTVGGRPDLPELSAALPERPGDLPSPTGQRDLPDFAPSVPGLVNHSADQPESLEFEDDFDELGDDDFASSPSGVEQPVADEYGERDLATGPGGQTAADDLFEGRSAGQAGSLGGSATGPSAFGQVDFSDAEDDEDEFDAFPTEAEGSPREGGTQDAVGGTGYGDVALDEGDDDVGIGAEIERRGAAAAATAQVDRPGSPGAASPDQQVPEEKVPRSGLTRGTKIGIAAALIVAVGGGALAALPDVGPYGVYAIVDLIKADSYRSTLSADRDRALDLLGRDTASAYDEAFQVLDSGIATAPRYEERKAYAAFVGLMRESRFGSDQRTGARARALLQELSEETPEDVHYLGLARVALDAANGNFAKVAALGQSTLAGGPEFAMLLGEAGLRTANADLAAAAFERLATSQKSAQARFGQARAALLAGQVEQAVTWADQTLQSNPEHAGAKILRARLALEAREDVSGLVEMLRPYAEGKGGVSQGQQVSALVVLADLYMAQSRINQAQETYEKALALSSGDAAAQRGLADALFASGRFSEAQTRYEAALKTEPDNLNAALGLVKSKLRLEELEEAVALLAKLQEKHPQSTRVSYWVGRAKEDLGELAEARQAFEQAIEFGDKGEILVESYVALTRLLGRLGLTEAAQKVIAEAQEKFPDDPAVYRALAELSESRGAFEEAISFYDKAMKLDPEDLGLVFGRGIALRKARRFVEAAEAFDAVEAESKDYPGLALERGNLFEASGKTEQALEAYERALEAAPQDPDLKLRVGCGKAAAGQPGPARELLDQVLEDRPNSAEVNFCIGLALLEEGKDYPEARRYLQRAVSFDASRARYHLYMGWVALEMDDYGVAYESLEKAIELDQTLADAYWKKGELLVKQGAVEDAQSNLLKALELAPSRYEAHAALALAHTQLGQEQEALAEWKKATQNDGAEPYWHFLYGKLLLDNRRVEEAREQLSLAIDKVKQQDQSEPLWRWEAHRNLAMALGRQEAALEHWKAFIDQGPSQSPYRAEAVREANAILNQMGR